MTALRLLARPALAAVFITSGIDAIRHPKDRAIMAEPVALPIARRFGLPEDPVRLVQANGAVGVVAGSMLAFGRLPRLASAALLASLVPTTLAGHRFWDEEDPTLRAQQKAQFLKNVALAGGLLLGVADTAGRPSMTWWARRAARRAAAAAAGAASNAAALAAGAAGTVESLVGDHGSSTGRLADAATAAASTAASGASHASHAATHAASSAASTAAVVADNVREAAITAFNSAEKVLAGVPNHLRSH